MANLSNIRVSSRYATALFELAVEYKQLDVVKKDMELVVSVVESSRDLVLVFRSPLVNVDKKIKILESIFSQTISKLTFSFLALITRKGRIVHLDTIADGFMKLFKEHNRIKTVYIDSAAEMDSKVKDRIKQKLAEHTGYSIELHSSVQPSLIGGFRLRYDDFMYDLSLKKKLLSLRKEFETNIYKRKI